jgi:excisionase family DNA binding protein
MKLSEVHDEDVLTPKQVASAIHKSPSLVRKAIAKGELRAYRLGRGSLLTKGGWVRQWLEANVTNLADSKQEINIASTSIRRINRAVGIAFRSR